jgi:hypothetical protein
MSDTESPADVDVDVVVAKKRATLPINVTSVKNVVKQCGCSISADAISSLLATVEDLTRYVVQQQRIYHVSAQLTEKLDGKSVKLTKSVIEVWLGQLDVGRQDRPKFAASVSAALTTAVANACFATKRIRGKSADKPIVQAEVIEHFLSCFM